MKMQRNEKILKFLGSSAIALVFFSVGAFAQGEEKKEEISFVLDKIIVKVDNYVVLKSELEAAYQGYLTEGNPASDEAKCGLLNRLIMNKLMVDKAELEYEIVTEREVHQNLPRRMHLIMPNHGK